MVSYDACDIEAKSCAADGRCSGSRFKHISTREENIELICAISSTRFFGSVKRACNSSWEYGSLFRRRAVVLLKGYLFVTIFTAITPKLKISILSVKRCGSRGRNHAFTTSGAKYDGVPENFERLPGEWRVRRAEGRNSGKTETQILGTFFWVVTYLVGACDQKFFDSSLRYKDNAKS